jgi:DNA-binding HxlR family transcriptional regulator
MNVTNYSQFCALARASEILGERWTLLILRELYLGPKRFSDLKERLEPIAPGVLNGRLRSLRARGVIARRDVPPPTPAAVYELTEAGRALEPALMALLRWGARYLLPERAGERFEPDWFRMVLASYARTGPVPDVDIAIAVMDGVGGAVPAARIRGGPGGVEVSSDTAAAAAVIRGTPVALLGLIAGRLTLEDAEQRGTVTVSGDRGGAAAIGELFARAGP